MIFGKRKKQSEKSIREKKEFTQNEFELIISAYGETLENHGPPINGVADVKFLPLPKELIKRALLFGIQNIDDPNFRNHLQIGLMQLAHWQEGVGDKAIGIDDSFFDPNKGEEEILNQWISPDLENTIKEMEKWKPIIEKEQNEILSELNKLEG